jgi:hypothetical protein
VIESCEYARLTIDTSQSIRITGYLTTEQLERDLAAE